MRNHLGEGDAGAAAYKSLSLNARLASGLCAATRWLEHVGLHDPDLDAWIEHLWAWLQVTPDSFQAWYSAEPSLVAMGGSQLPPHLATKCAARRVTPDRLFTLIEETTEILYGSLFGAADDDYSMARLVGVERAVAQDGVTLPPGYLFRDSPASSGHGWGPRLDADLIQRWRNATW